VELRVCCRSNALSSSAKAKAFFLRLASSSFLNYHISHSIAMRLEEKLLEIQIHPDNIQCFFGYFRVRPLFYSFFDPGFLFFSFLLAGQLVSASGFCFDSGGCGQLLFYQPPAFFAFGKRRLAGPGLLP
jgi:hypothetical protein